MDKGKKDEYLVNLIKNSRSQSKIEEVLEFIMINYGRIEEIGFCRRIIEYYDEKGFDVENYKSRQSYREDLVNAISLN